MEKKYRCNHCGKLVSCINPPSDNLTCGYCGEGVFIEEYEKPQGERGDRFTNQNRWPEDFNITVGNPRTSDDTKLKMCPECRILIVNSARYCHNCGAEQPEEKSIEELAEEYINNKFVCPVNKDDIFDRLNECFDDISNTIESQLKQAFIDGRKSTEPKQ